MGEAEGGEDTVAVELGEAIWRTRHSIVSAMARDYNNDVELGAAVRNWLGQHEQEFARPRGRASRYAPY